MKQLLIFIFCASIFSSSAQLLDGAPSAFNKGDTLRGALRPERTAFDVNYYHLNLALDFEARTIAGYNDIAFTMQHTADSLQIDLFDNMQIDSIVYRGLNLKYYRYYNAVFVKFPKALKKETQHSMRVYYNGKPIIAKNAPWDGGFTWETDEEGMPWIGVSCEGIGASLWWPNKDHLSDEPDSMRITCTVPSALTFVGNGVLEQDEIEEGKRSMTWKVSYPINNYNVTLNIANYVNFQDSYTAQDGENLLLDYWVLPYNLEKAKAQFKQVQPMLSCFEQYFGKYPFWEDSYKLVETPYLGMEHQSAIAYGNKYKTGYLGRDYSGIGLDFDYIIIHETGHEYFGNLISAEDIADMWIHESFCTYSEAIYVECMYDYEKAQDYVNAKKRTVNNIEPIAGIYGVNVEGSADMYNKGMLFLNTLRHVIANDSIWYAILKDINTDLGYKTVNANDIMRYFNKKSGMDLTPLFLQYVFYPNQPELMYSLKRLKGKKYSLKYKWIADVKDFNMPIELSVADKKMRLKGSTSLQEQIVKKKKSKKLTFNQNQFYYKLTKY